MNHVSSALLAIAVSFGSAALALAVSYGIIAATGGDPNEAARALWDGAFGSRAQVAGTLSELIPLVLVALGWIVAFSARRINIGFEGQILVGGIMVPEALEASNRLHAEGVAANVIVVTSSDLLFDALRRSRRALRGSDS